MVWVTVEVGECDFVIGPVDGGDGEARRQTGLRPEAWLREARPGRQPAQRTQIQAN